MVTRAVLYARVSSDDRAKPGDNLAGQLELCRTHAQQQGYQVVAELAEDERGASGADWDLPQLSKALEMAQRGDFDRLVVRELDRLSRDMGKLYLTERELSKAGVVIEYTLYDFAPTPEGQLQKGIHAAFTQYERVKITERMMRARRSVAAHGAVLTHGDRPPYGYRLTEDRRGLVVHEPEARIVRQVFDWYTRGDDAGARPGVRAIATRLTAMRAPTWQDVHGLAYKKRGVGEWGLSSILRILRTETYTGTWYYGRRNAKAGVVNPREHWIAVPCPAIVDADTFQAARDRRGQNAEASPRNVQRSYLMRSRLTCQCGRAMVAHAVSRKLASGKKREHLYYKCTSENAPLAERCHAHGFRAAPVDEAVWEWAWTLLTDPERVAADLERESARRERDAAQMRERLGIVEDGIADQRGQLARLLDLYLGGGFDKELLEEKRARIEQVIAGLEREKARLAAWIAANTLQPRQVQDAIERARELAGALHLVEGNRKAQRGIVEALDIRAVCAVENGEQVLRLSANLGRQAVVTCDPHYWKCKPQPATVLTLYARLVLVHTMAVDREAA